MIPRIKSWKKLVCLIGQLGLGGSETQLVSFLKASTHCPYSMEVWTTTPGGSREAEIATMGIPIKNFFHRSRLARALAMRKEALHVELDIWWSWSYHSNAYCHFIPRSVVRIGSLRGSLASYRSEVGWASHFCETGLDLLVVNSSQLLAECERAGLDVQLAWIGNIAKNGRKIGESMSKRPRKDGNTIVSVGRLDANKGIGLVLRALSQPDCRDVVCLIVGDGPQRNQLESECKELAISDRVTFVGSSCNAIEYIRRADVLVHPSYSEGLPNVIMESIDCETPVLARDMGSIRDLIPTEDHGWLFRDDDPHKLASLIRNVLDHPVESSTKVVRAKERLHFLFNSNRVLQRIDDWLDYLNALGPRPPREFLSPE